MTRSTSFPGSCNPWTTDEDAILRQFAIEQHPWSEVTQVLKRTVSACQTRWNLKLRTPADQKKFKQHKKKLANAYKATTVKLDGDAIAGDHYVFKVPTGDPLLQRLIAIHGKDSLRRDVYLIRKD